MFRGTWRDEKHGPSVRTVSVDDVGWTKPVITSEVENSNSIVRQGQLRDTCSAGSDNFETKFKDHELEDGTQALVPSECREVSCDSAFGRRVLRPMPGPLCGIVGGERDDDPKKDPPQNKHMINNSSEGRRSGLPSSKTLSTAQRNLTFNTPAFGFVCDAA